MSARTGIVLAAVLLLLGAVGCGASASNTYYGGDRFPPRPSDYPIEIVNGPAQRPHIALGEVSGRHPAMVGQQTGDEVIQLLKQKAREMGGDAIVQYDGYVAHDGTVGQGTYSAHGIVVRWK